MFWGVLSSIIDILTLKNLSSKWIIHHRTLDIQSSGEKLTDNVHLGIITTKNRKFKSLGQEYFQIKTMP